MPDTKVGHCDICGNTLKDWKPGDDPLDPGCRKNGMRAERPDEKVARMKQEEINKRVIGYEDACLVESYTIKGK